MHACLVFNVISGAIIIDKYGFGVVGTSGPSMLPTLNTSNDLVFVDYFTTKFIRDPKKEEVVIVQNPYKQSATLVKRVKFTAGETAEYIDPSYKKLTKVEVPKNHIWIEGDNPDESRDSRHMGAYSLELVNGIVRYRIWPFESVRKL